jgi:hypothetical protein
MFGQGSERSELLGAVMWRKFTGRDGRRGMGGWQRMDGWMDGWRDGREGSVNG